MNRLLALVAICVIACSCAKPQDEKSDRIIVAGQGWGDVHIGASRKSISKVLGYGSNYTKYKDVYFVDYPKEGIQVSYLNGDDTANAIFFYNNEKGREHFDTFKGKTSNGINWNSTMQEVIKAYGEPIYEYKSRKYFNSSVRLEFKNIDFRFENDKMVRISVPVH